MTEPGRKTSLDLKINTSTTVTILRLSHLVRILHNVKRRILQLDWSEHCQSKYTEPKINGCMLKCSLKR